ncbi:MAG: aminotransferase class V-fold PLP-dependent enzyme [Acidobacteriota bacterium]
MPTLDLPFIRSQFPAFSEPSLEGWAFFENAGGSYPCRQTIERLEGFYTRHKLQPYYGFPASQAAGAAMDEAYDRLARYLNLEVEEVHFGPSTSQNTYVLAEALAGLFETGSEIVVSDQDHEANAGVWRRLADRGFIVREWQLDPETGHLDPAQLAELLNEKTAMVAFPHCSNVVGEVNPVAEVTGMARSVGAISVVDGVAYAPHGLPDVAALGADVYLFSLYKTWGPHQGLMTVRRDLMERLPNQSHFFNDGEVRKRLVPAGPDHAQIAASAGIADYLDEVYQHHWGDSADASERGRRLHELFRQHEEELLEPLLDFLLDREDLRVLGPAAPGSKAPTVSVLPLRKSVAEVYDALTEHRIMAGSGNFYGVRPLTAMDIPLDPGVIRLSFLHYTSAEEMEQLIAALRRALD